MYDRERWRLTHLQLSSHRHLSRRTILGGIAAGLLTRAVRAADDDTSLYGLSALIDGTGLVRIPAGEFSMGLKGGHDDEQPAHRVRITHPFDIGKFEVTQAQWETVLSEAHPTPGVKLRNSEGAEVSRTPSHFQGASLPVETVSWHDVQLFLSRLNDRDPSHHYRLPTEAEWEYACKAGRHGETASEAEAWTKENSKEQTHAAGQKSANPWGVFDMQGNAAEWVEDWYSRDYYEQGPHLDPTGPRTGSYRVYRGGAWLDEPGNCRATYRGFDFPVSKFYNVGFRIVRTVV